MDIQAFKLKYERHVDALNAFYHNIQLMLEHGKCKQYVRMENSSLLFIFAYLVDPKDGW
jgi:hypothetical protein